jgi:hypothetical protein
MPACRYGRLGARGSRKPLTYLFNHGQLNIHRNAARQTRRAGKVRYPLSDCTRGVNY